MGIVSKVLDTFLLLLIGVFVGFIVAPVLAFWGFIDWRLWLATGIVIVVLFVLLRVLIATRHAHVQLS